MKKASKIDWDKVWDVFDKWFEKTDATPDSWHKLTWEKQTNKIQSLVEAQLRRKHGHNRSV